MWQIFSRSRKQKKQTQNDFEGPDSDPASVEVNGNISIDLTESKDSPQLAAFTQSSGISIGYQYTVHWSMNWLIAMTVLTYPSFADPQRLGMKGKEALLMSSTPIIQTSESDLSKSCVF